MISRDKIEQWLEPSGIFVDGLLIAVILVAIWAIVQRSNIVRAAVAAWFLFP